jgi:hypothetical protein
LLSLALAFTPWIAQATGPRIGAHAERTLWIAAGQAEKLSPLMARGSELRLAEDGALGDFLVPTVTAGPTQPGDASFAQFHLDIPQAGTYYLWARLRCPSGRPEAFAASASTAKSPGVQVLGGSGVGVRQWHWDSRGEDAASAPGTRRLRLELPAGACTLRVQACQAGASVFYPLRWRQAEPAFNPQLNTLCLTSDPQYVPDDQAAGRALGEKPSVPAVPRVEAISLPALSDAQWQAAGKRRLPDWMRCPRWYTKDAWYEETAHRHPDDIAALVRQVAASGGSALRLSVYYGGYAFYQSRVTPHVSGLGDIDYLREAVDEGRSTGVKIVVYMNPNCLREGHPLFDACSVRDAEDRAVPCGKAYGSNGANSRYACINHPRYRQFLRDVLREIFAGYRPAGLYVDGLTPHVCCCEHCRAKYREMFGVEMPAAKLSRVVAAGVTWGEYGGDPEPVGDVENDLDCRRLTEMMYRSLVEVTHEFTATVKGCQPEAVTAYHSHPKPACEADYDATLTEVYRSQPWVHAAWRCGELAGFSNVFRVPVLFNVYPHEHFTAAEARYKAIQGLAAGAYPNFWSTPGMQPVLDFMRRNAEYLDFATTSPVRFIALPRDVRLDSTQAATPAADGVRYQDDRFLAPAVGAYAALIRCGLPVVTLHRPHFHERLAGFQVLCLANMTNMSDAQVEAVRRFVRSGGGLIASHETSLYDEKGRRRPDFGLADLFGARFRRVLAAAPGRVQFEPVGPLATGFRIGQQTSTGTEVGRIGNPSYEQRIGNPSSHEADLRDGLPIHPTGKPTLVRSPILSGLPPLEHAGPHVAVDLTTGRSAARLTGPDLASDLPAAVVHEFGEGRVVYLPGRLDALECYQLTPQVERLFANAVRWLMRDRLPIEVSSPGMVGVSYFRQPQRLLVHLVNHDRDSRFRDDAFRPLTHVRVRLQLPPGFEVSRVHRLWTPSDVAYQCNREYLQAELDSIGEYELLAVELRRLGGS